MVHPVVVGGGRKLFGETTEVRPLTLVHVRQVGEGVVILTYEPIPGPDRAQGAAATVAAEAQ